MSDVSVGRAAAAALSALIAGVVLTFLALPIIALFTEFPLRDVPELLRDPFVQDTLKVTARTNAIANVLIIGLGTPTAYLVAMRRFRGRALVDHAHRAAARPASRGRGHRAALGVRRRRAARARR